MMKMAWKAVIHIKGRKELKKMALELPCDEGYLLPGHESFQQECFRDGKGVTQDFIGIRFLVRRQSFVSHLEKFAAVSGMMYSQNVNTVKLINEIGRLKFQATEVVKDTGSASHTDLL